MNPAEEEVNSASPLNTAGTTEATGNIRQPARISQPAANPARTTNTTTPGPNGVPPEPASVPAGTTEATGNIRQPARISQPAANPARTTNTTTPGPNRVPPEPASVPAGTTEATGNIRQPARISQPAANPARTTNTTTPGPNRVPPEPASVPAGTTEATGNIRQPARISQPAANPARTTNTTTPGPNRVPPEPASVPAAANRPPAPRPAGPPRNPGPVRGPPGPVRGPPGPVRGPPGPVRGHPRPGARPPHVLYKPAKISTLRRYCVPVTTAALVVASLVVIAILIKVVLDNYYFFCLKSFKFIPLDKWCDGKEDCANGEDELQCVQRVDFSNTTIVRLTNDSILQILTASGTWSYICSDGFDTNSAKSVCAEIGFSSKPTFSSVSAATLNGPFGNFLLSGGGIQAIPLSGACTSGSIISLRCIDCGINHKKERIVGGQDTTIENSPWQCSLQYMGQHSCGCSIITPQIILTAAHCFPRGQQQTERWRVECGHARLSFLFSAQVAKIFVPTSYNLDHKPNDIALIKLKSDLSLSATVQPVCLPGFDDNLKEGAPLTVTGWGHTVEGGGTLASTLQGVTIFLISNELCNREYFGQILPTMICAGQTGGGKDTCQGDSGGPLVSLGPNSLWQQNGIVSWGDGCARAGKPGVYTKVAPFVSWITSLMKKELPPQ